MKSPKDIAKAAFMGAGFCVPFSGGLRYMIPHRCEVCNR
nr:MAG TPA: zinc-finger double domain protein [Caudoviricetes sp.]